MTPERKELTTKLDHLFADYIKHRDGHICQRCGKLVTGLYAHCSHVIPKSRGIIYRWEPCNAKLLCWLCHGGWWHMNPLTREIWFQEMFPERWKVIERLKKEPLIRYSDEDLLTIMTCLTVAMHELPPEPEEELPF